VSNFAQGVATVAAAAVLGVVAGCSAESGTPTANESDVASYREERDAERKQDEEAARQQVCGTFQTTALRATDKYKAMIASNAVAGADLLVRLDEAKTALRESADSVDEALDQQEDVPDAVATALQEYASATRTLADETERWPTVKTADALNAAAEKRDGTSRTAANRCA
jgi:hypothetical protein